MNVNKEDRIQDRREYGRNYYRINREQILAKQRQLSEESKISKKLRRADIIMLTEWSERLTERLKDTDLSSWLRWALELTRDEITKKMDKINGKN